MFFEREPNRADRLESSSPSPFLPKPNFFIFGCALEGVSWWFCGNNNNNTFFYEYGWSKGFKVPDLKLDKDASLRAVRVAEPHLCVAFSVDLDLVYLEHLVLLLSMFRLTKLTVSVQWVTTKLVRYEAAA